METEYVPGAPPREARTWAMWCHLGSLTGLVLQVPLANIIVPLIIWNMKKGDDPFIDEHGRESLNFQITLIIYALISVILILLVVGIFMLIALYLFGIICVIIAAIRAADGREYRYPLTIRLL